MELFTPTVSGANTYCIFTMHRYYLSFFASAPPGWRKTTPYGGAGGGESTVGSNSSGGTGGSGVVIVSWVTANFGANTCGAFYTNS